MEKKNLPITSFSEENLWNYLCTEEIYCHLRGNDVVYPCESFPNIWAIGAKKIVDTNENDIFQQLKNQPNDYYFGYFSYDLKNKIEKLSSQNPENISFPETFFFSPQHIIEKKENHWVIFSDETELLVKKINNAQKIDERNISQKIDIKPAYTQDEYCQKIEKIKQHIEEGDIYEMNFCMDFRAENVVITPEFIFQQLMQISPMPFSSFIRIKNLYAFGASPERFLKKEGQILISQPIKGTAKRGSSPQEDFEMKKYLLENEKERAENMMIVDLVRNDLAKSAQIGSTYVDEMFGIYTFRHLHQMISTVKCTLSEKIHWADAIKNAFPMGSMTGAPKIKSMELIEAFEEAKRGLFSGAIGYISPEANFDFNVVIRHIFYETKQKKLHFWVGSAITYDADANKEYEECFLKAKPIFEVLKRLTT